MRSTRAQEGCRRANFPKRKEEAMKSLINRAKMFVVHEDGPTATEYAVMLALIVIVALAAISSLGTRVRDVFTEVTTGLGG
jgi:pilus assembly protein Flp/PilA